MSTQIERFLDHLSVERGLSANTLSAYRRDLARYASSLASREVRDARAVDDAAVAGFIARLSPSTHHDGRPYRATSVVRALSSVRSFHRFLMREGRADRDPSAGVVRPKRPRPLSVEDVQRLLASPPDETPAGLRDRAVLEMLYGAGLRVTELVGLDVDDRELESRGG